jgi:hypothetical protein
LRDVMPSLLNTADFGVRQALAGESGDLRLLRSELVAGLDCAFADALAGGQELSLGPRGERAGAHAGEHLKRRAELFSGVEASALASQSFPVEQVRAGEVETDAVTGEVHDRVAVQALGGVALAQQRAHTGLGSEHPLRADHTGAP